MSEKPTATGIEALVCADIAERQQFGLQKYGCTVADSPDDMQRHLYEELLDAAIYYRAEMEKPCTALAPVLKRGDKLEVVENRGGHVFAFILSQPGYAVCIGCGRAMHEVFPIPKK